MIGDHMEKRTVGMATLLVLGALAGFVVASSTTGAEYATVETIGSDSQAYALPAEEDERVRFTLSADDGTAITPEVNFAMYDPADDFFAQFQLSGDGDSVETLLEEKGDWVLFLTHRQNAKLDVQYQTQDEESAQDVELEQLDITEKRTEVVEQDGEALEKEMAMRMDRRPAVTFLEYDGDIENLDATVETEEGVAYELSDAQANTTGDSTERSGETTVKPGNLVAGTYRVSAQADSFDGSLDLVHQQYVREDASTYSEEAPDKPDQQPVEERPDLALVAEMGEGQAYEIDTQGQTQLGFALQDASRATIFVYDGDNNMTQAVDIERENRDSKDHDKDANQSSEQQPGLDATVELEEPGNYVLYVQYLYDDEGKALALLPGVESAESGEELEFEEHQIVLEGNEANATSTVTDGALTGLEVRVNDPAAMDREVTVEGPQGTIFEASQPVSTFGSYWYEDYEYNPENLSDGEMSIQTNAELFTGSVDVTLHQFVR
jgi:hypothetical protein